VERRHLDVMSRKREQGFTVYQKHFDEEHEKVELLKMMVDLHEISLRRQLHLKKNGRK
jgi:hypothetical protein